MKIQVPVTRTHIATGLTQTSTQCAFAQALKDFDDDYIFPRVTQKTISWTDRRQGVRYSVPTPEKVARFIDTWDRDPTRARAFTIVLDMEQAKERPIKHANVHRRIKEAERVRNLRVRQAEPVKNSYRPLRPEG